MPYHENTRRISPEEWEERKFRIIELFITQRRTLDGPDGVIEMMKGEHFDATISQYENQFRKWKVRKNKSRIKQTRIIDGAHQVDVAQDNNQTTSRGRLRRARRRPAPRNYQGEESVPSTAQAEDRHVFELDSERAILNGETDLTAIAITPNAGVEPILSNQNMHPFIWTADDSNAADSDTPLADSRSDLYEPQDLSSLFNGVSFNLSPQPVNNAFWSMSQSSINNSSHARATPFESSPAVLSSRPDWLQNPLPSAKLVARFVNYIYTKSPTVSASRTPIKSIFPEFLLKFLNVVAESIPSSKCLTDNIPVLYNLTSLETLTGEEWSQLAELSYEKSLEARFDARLLASVINSFSSLGDIPASSVLKFLDRHSTSQRVMLDFLKAPSSPLAKSFIEKAFLAYIEADNADAVNFLLNSQLLDVDKAICHRRGDRFTPLEYAAINKSFKVLQLLIRKNIDVNKSLQSHAHDSNALLLLIEGVEDYRGTLSHDLLCSVDALLQAEATVLMRTINIALRLTDSRLVVRILKYFASQKPQNIVLHENLLERIIKSLDERNATETIQFIINKCRELGKLQDLYRFALHTRRALQAAVYRGYNKLAEVLFPYMSSLATTLQMAGEAGNQAAFKSILQKRSDLGNDLGLDNNPNLIKNSEVSDIFTALTSGDENFLRSLDNSGAINRLRGVELGRALTVALRVGNLEYATKLLELDPDLNFCRDGLVHDGVVVFDVAYALRSALTHNFDNIAWDLLAVGLTTETDSKQNAPTLLYVAVEKERPEFVKAIIEFGFKLNILQEDFENPWPILETAIECSDNSIFDDVWKARLHPFRPSKRLYELVLQKGRRDLFFDIVKSSPQMPDSSRTMALEAAVECENESLLDELISLGVPADDDIILRKAVKNHHSMVRPLLERFWKAYPQGRVGYGKTLIVKAIRRYSQSPESLKMMFDWNLVTMNIGDQAYSEEPPLLWHAIQTRDCHVVERFINVGNNVNTISRIDRHFGYSNARSSALLVAINTEVIEMVQLLIDHGANVHEPAQFLPRTPLQKAAEMNNIPIVRLLLDSGADVNAAPAKFGGATALQFAAIHGNCEMATILIEHGARQEIRPSCGPGGRYPLEGAAENGRFDMLELLWNAPRDPFDDKQCQKAMKLAAQNGHFGCKEKIEELMARDVAPWTSMLQN
ncbi:hypothetical protein F4860DRAFT_329015 [Xylaria cubensis]|nr:hypothetical protein F4860DRAFT_329015 [Xylaria cubensis]